MKKTISLLMLAVLLMAMLPGAAYAADEAVISVVPSVAALASGEEFSADICISGNPGMAGFALTLEYDSKLLTLLEVKKGGLPNGFFVANTDTGVISWVGSGNSDFNGVLATATFRVNADAAGESELGVSYQPGDITNWELEDLSMTVKSAKLTVKAAQTPVQSTAAPQPTPTATAKQTASSAAPQPSVEAENEPAEANVQAEPADKTAVQAAEASADLALTGTQDAGQTGHGMKLSLLIIVIMLVAAAVTAAIVMKRKRK